MKRAYSLLQVKEFDDEQRVIRGMATTPSPDRVGDVVEPLGVQVAADVPLFLYHDSTKTVGRAKFGKATKSGIPFEAHFPRVTEAGALRDRIEEAWQLAKYRLVTGVSIGFRVLNDAVETLKEGGLRFLETEVMELSLVPIPANADATILSVKSITKSVERAATGQRSAVYLKNPGASGKHSTPKGPDMKISEQIKALEEQRKQAESDRNAVQQKAMDEGRTKDEDERDQFNEYNAIMKKIDVELADLREIEKTVATTAVEVKTSAAEVKDGFVTTKTNLQPCARFVRAAMALHCAKGDRAHAAEIAKQRWGHQTPEVERYLKTAVNGLDSTTSGAASQLAYARDMESEFVEYLRPMTVMGKLTGLRRVPFNIRYGTQTAVSTANWVGQGLAIPVSKPTVSSGSLGIAKASGLVVIDEELAKLSSPSAEALVRDDLAKTLSVFLDVQFLDPNVAASANVSPASITNGVTAVAATGTSAATLRTDLATIYTNLARNELDMSGLVWIMTPETAWNIALMLSSLGVPLYPTLNGAGGTLLGHPVVTSNSANIPGSPASGRMIIAAIANEILVADEGGVSIDVSNQASIQMDDAPTNKSTATATGASLVSMFQTHSLAIRCTRFVNWAKRRSTAVEYIKEAAYSA